MFVMPGLVPAIHISFLAFKTWTAGLVPAMTSSVLR